MSNRDQIVKDVVVIDVFDGIIFGDAKEDVKVTSFCLRVLIEFEELYFDSIIF